MTQAEYHDRVRRHILSRGEMAFKAVEGRDGNCLNCGESGRCPGWHTTDGKIEWEPSESIFDEEPANAS